jgi:mannose-1-phosphate guanylyltransferase
MVEAKPWGVYSILAKGGGYQVKRVEINPGKRLSLQKHAQRTEDWTIVSGTGTVTLGDKEIPVKRSSSVHIPIGELHRIHNTGRDPLVFIEVQFGEYLGEDDIVRIQDDFDRA